jgi:integrase
MALENYLFKRRNSQHWQLRWMVPKAAREAVGRAEFTKSLGVTNRREAEELAFVQLGKWQGEVAKAEGRARSYHHGPKRPITEAEFDAYLANTQYELGRAGVPGLVRQRHRELGLPLIEQRQRLAEQHDRLNERIFLGQVDDYLEVPEFSLNGIGYMLPEEPALRKAFARKAALCIRDTLAHGIAALDAKAECFVPSEFITSAKAREAAKAKPGESIMNLFDRYAAQRLAEKRKRQDTIDQDRKVVEQFAEFIGKDRSVRSISASEVRDWRDVIADLPPAFRKWKVNEGLSMREAAAKGKALGLKGVTPTTVNKYLSTVSPFIKWCRQNSYIDHDPCDGLFYDLQKVKRRRPSFGIDELNRIIASPLFTGFLKAGKEFEAGAEKADDWRYWLPLVCMFTGARIGEVAQLSVEDVKEQDGIAYLLIRHDEETGQTTKSGYNRPAAIHPVLNSIGFLHFVERQRKRVKAGGNQQLFLELKRDDRGQAGKCSRFWRTYLKRIGLKEGADGFGAHSFRHTMADQLRLAGHLDDEIEVALGHNQVSVTARYGSIRQGTISRLAKMMADVKFEGLRYHHLVPDNLNTA